MLKLHKKGMTLLENKLLVDYVADLQALYYLSIDQHQYSENYMFRFKYFQMKLNIMIYQNL